jgi:hypothetical protein
VTVIADIALNLGCGDLISPHLELNRATRVNDRIRYQVLSEWLPGFCPQAAEN